MPSTWRAHVIAQRLRREGVSAEVVERDVYSLSGLTRHLVLDAMVFQRHDLPMVLVGAAVVCHGDLDLEAIVDAAKGRHTGAHTCC
jgi:hypothetical protein